MKSIILSLFLFTGSLLMFACNDSKTTSNAKEEVAAMAITEPAATMAPPRQQEPKGGEADVLNDIPVNQTPLIIRSADMRMEVKNIEQSTEAIEKLIASTGSFIGKSNYATTNEAKESQMVLRVKADRFDFVMKELSKQAIFLNNRNVYTEDITMEFIDTDARLRNKKEVEQRYLNILRTQARTVKDVLAAEEQLRQIREEIEAKEGQLRYMKNQLAMSTINLVIYQKTEYAKPPEPTEHTFGNKLLNALQNGWNFIAQLVLFLVSIWPLLGTGLVFLWLWRRKKQNLKQE